MKTLALCFALAALVLPPPARALPLAPDHPVIAFATCAGRLSATMEHQWMFDGPGSERTEAQRAAMISLLEAVMPAELGREVLHLRLEAKFAQAALLARARFNDDAEDAVRAGALAGLRLAECTGMLLS
ncbi:hypothetical protein [Marinovum sp.]|uniref:hypothetical protein n=1 Tax=Marinovum sp. TaxID=2024839 RepID=UPI002B2799AE|nr:hypothetical protein [Marinovum sp.]